jgi:DnaJ domain/Lecithin retinol acyltransferase
MPTVSIDISTLTKAENFQPGDHIKARCWGIFFHHAIFEEMVDEKTGRAIHYQPSNEGQEKASVIRSEISLGDYRVVLRPSNPITVLGRARGMLDSEKYHVVVRNCEHFANYCVMGEFVSESSMLVTRTVGTVLLRGSLMGQLLPAVWDIGCPIAGVIIRYWKGKITSKEDCAWEIMKSLSNCNAGMAIFGFAGGALGLAAATSMGFGPFGAAVTSLGVATGAIMIIKRIYYHLCGNVIRDDPKLTLEEAYKILGFENRRDIDMHEVDRAYRKLCLKYHPDKNGDAEKFVEVTTAMEVIRIANEEANARNWVTRLREDAFKNWIESAAAVEEGIRKLKDKETQIDSQLGLWIEIEEQQKQLTFQIKAATASAINVVGKIQAQERIIRQEQEHLIGLSLSQYKAERDLSAALEYQEDVKAFIQLQEDLKASAQARKSDAERQNKSRRFVRAAKDELEATRNLSFLNIKLRDASEMQQKAERNAEQASMDSSLGSGNIVRAKEEISEMTAENSRLLLEIEHLMKEIPGLARNAKENKTEFEHIFAEKKELEKELRQLEAGLSAADDQLKDVDKAQQEVNEKWGVSHIQFLGAAQAAAMFALRSSTQTFQINQAQSSKKAAELKAKKSQDFLRVAQNSREQARLQMESTVSRYDAMIASRDTVKVRYEKELVALETKLEEDQALASQKSDDEAQRRSMMLQERFQAPGCADKGCVIS